MENLTSFLVIVFVSAGIVWVLGRMMLVNIDYKWLVVAIVASSVVSFIPYIGIFLSFAVLLWFIYEFSDAQLWPNIILLVLISKVFNISIFLQMDRFGI